MTMLSAWKLVLVVGISLSCANMGRASFSQLSSKTGLTDSEKQEILKYSNGMRLPELIGSKSSSDMRLLVWSDKLAETAQAWADKCDSSAHDQNSDRIGASGFDYVGQNVQRVYPEQDDAAKLGFKQFIEEKDDYDLDTDKCATGKQCGHYTQLAWANSQFIGCGYNNNCPNKNIGKFVCNYGPAGNFVGQKPFKEGLPCSACPKKANFCLKGICTDKKHCPSGDQCVCQVAASSCKNGATFDAENCLCKCASGFTGLHCESVCVDKYPKANCEFYKNGGYCAHPALVGQCDLTCEKCDAEKPYNFPESSTIHVVSFSPEETKAALGI